METFTIAGGAKLPQKWCDIDQSRWLPDHAVMDFLRCHKFMLLCCISPLAMIVLTGCTLVGGTKGAIRAQSLGDDPVLLQGSFRNVVFAYEPNGEPSFILSDVQLNQVASGEASTAQVLRVQLLWDPVAGRTPMEPSATNASIRYVVIANGEVGVYSGAGFATYSGNLETDKRVTLTLRDASLQLQDATAGFNDLLSPAQMTGTFTALRDDVRARQMQREASQFVTNALGKTRLVHTAGEHDERRGRPGVDQ